MAYGSGSSKGGSKEEKTEIGPGSKPEKTAGKGRSFWGADVSRGKIINERREFGPGNGRSSPDVSREQDKKDEAKKLARIAAIKKAALNNKKYNVRTDTTPVDPSSASAVAPILYGGTGGGGYYGSAEMVGNGGGFSFSDIPSIVWIVLAVGVGWFLISSSGGKGKGKGSLF